MHPSYLIAIAIVVVLIVIAVIVYEYRQPSTSQFRLRELVSAMSSKSGAAAKPQASSLDLTRPALPEAYERMPSTDWERGMYWTGAEPTTGRRASYQSEGYSVPGTCTSGFESRMIKAPYMYGPNAGDGRVSRTTAPPDRPASTVWHQPGMMGKTIQSDSAFTVSDLPSHDRTYVLEGVRV